LFTDFITTPALNSRDITLHQIDWIKYTTHNYSNKTGDRMDLLQIGTQLMTKQFGDNIDSDCLQNMLGGLGAVANLAKGFLR